MPAYAKEMTQDLIMFVGARWCFMVGFFPSFEVPQTGKGKKERGMVCCSRLVGGDVEGGGNSSIFLALWSMT